MLDDDGSLSSDYDDADDSDADDSDADEQYSVVCIQDHRYSGAKRQYLVEWDGYDERTWEPAKNLEQSLLEDYFTSHPDARPPVRALMHHLAIALLSHHMRLSTMSPFKQMKAKKAKSAATGSPPNEPPNPPPNPPKPPPT